MPEMKDVTKTFGSFKALDCLSLNVPKGAGILRIQYYPEGRKEI